MTPAWIAGVYLAVGIFALAVLDATTGRVRKRLRGASEETREKLMQAMFMIGPRAAVVITVAALLLFWPAAYYGFVESKIEEARRKNGTQR